MALLELRDVSKIFSAEIEAVRDVSLDVDKGAFLSILGPSGCGKTTLLRLIAGLTQPTSGSLIMAGKSITGPGPERGVVFQEYTSFPWLSVFDNVSFGLRLNRRHSKQAAQARAREMIAAVGLEEFSHMYPGQLSGGQQQRVALARSLALNPEVLLLDEPFGALDAQTRNSMQTLLHRLWTGFGQTMLFVTHDIEEAIFLGETILISTTRPFRIASRFSSSVGQMGTHDVKVSKDFMDAERQVTLLLRQARKK